MNDLYDRISCIVADLAFGAGLDNWAWELKWHKNPDGQECLTAFVGPFRERQDFEAVSAFCFRDSPEALRMVGMSEADLTDRVKTSWFMMMQYVWQRSAPVAPAAA